jgi:integrase
MRRHQGHIRERSNGSWELRYSLGTDPATGRRRIATATIRGDRKAAENELRRLLRSRDTGEHADPNRLTVRQWLTEWHMTVRAEVSPKTHERYGEIVSNLLIPALGHLPLSKLAPSHIQQAYSRWAVTGRLDGKEGGFSPRTRRHIHRVFRSALARAVQQQVLARNPADSFQKRLPKIERSTMITLSAEQSVRLLEAIRHTRTYLPVMLALATGMRRGEVLAVRWKNVDLERSTLRVVESLEQTKGKGSIRFKAPKTDRHRAIVLPAFAVAELRRLKRQQAEQLLALGIRQTEDNLVCSRADGQPLQPQSLTHQFTRLIRRMNDLPLVRYHDLRHSHATTLLKNGVHPKIAQERLGHASITTTLDLYSHVTETIQADAAAQLDTVFQNAQRMR